MKYSVIIPIYNAAGTLERCLDSLLNQPHENAEILLINDGSTDESGGICRRYARQHDGVHYFEKENGGVSSARNLGLEHASGEYILFVDSDDYVAEDYFTSIDEAMERWKPDMLIFELKCFGAQDDIWKIGSFHSEDELGISTHVRELSRAYLYSNLMTRTFRREIIRANNLRFDETLLIGEDQTFIFAYTMQVKRMAAMDKVLYHYAVGNSDSLSWRSRTYLADQLLRVSLRMREALEQMDFPEPVRRNYQETIAWTHYRSAYSACKELRKFDLSDTARRSRIRGICRRFCSVGIVPRGLRTWMIALPVMGNMSRLIDSVSGHSRYYRKMIRQ